MKKMHKLLSVILALTMALSLAIPAFAVEPTTGKETDGGSITISHPGANATYNIYRIFVLESFSDTNLDNQPDADGSYSYKVDEDWEAFFATGAPGAEYITRENGYVTWVSGKNAADFAKAAIEWATGGTEGPAKVDADETWTNGPDNGTELVDSKKIDVATLGYYLVASSVGALCALDTTNPDVTVIEKNSAPSVDKKVEEDDKTTDKMGDKNDANVGAIVKFETTIKVQGYVKDYVLHDSMSEGLSFNNDTTFQVLLNNQPVNAGDYTLVTEGDVLHHDAMTDPVKPERTCTFHVVFSEDFCKKLVGGDVITVKYTATLNEKALINLANTNDTYLSYKDVTDNEHNTPDDRTETFTWGFNVWKHNEKQEALAGAKFVLSTNVEPSVTADYVNLVATATAGTYKVCTKDDNNDDTHKHFTEIETDATGAFVIEGLDSGEYYLHETAAPDGYNKLQFPVKVTIDDDGSVHGNTTTDGKKYNKDENAAANGLIKVENKTGPELPSTGGIGTTIFYIAGSIMVLGAVILLVTKRKMMNR